MILYCPAIVFPPKKLIKTMGEYICKETKICDEKIEKLSLASFKTAAFFVFAKEKECVISM